MILVFNNESKFYSYSFVLVPELLKEHSPLSTLFGLLFRLENESKNTFERLTSLSKKYKFHLETSIKTRTSVHHRVLHRVQLASKDGQVFIVFRKIALQNSDRWVQILLVHADFALRLRLIQER